MSSSPARLTTPLRAGSPISCWPRRFAPTPTPVYIEPKATSDDTYVISLERASRVLSTVSIDAQIGAAVIARLHDVPEDPWTEAVSLGLVGLTSGLEIP